jgi:hypothetical protein
MQNRQQNSGCRSRLGCLLRAILFIAIGFGLGAFAVTHGLTCQDVKADDGETPVTQRFIWVDEATEVLSLDNKTSSIDWTDFNIGAYCSDDYVTKFVYIQLRIHVDSWESGVINFLARKNGTEPDQPQAVMGIFDGANYGYTNEAVWLPLDEDGYIEYRYAISGTAQADYDIFLLGYIVEVPEPEPEYFNILQEWLEFHNYMTRDDVLALLSSNYTLYEHLNEFGGYGNYDYHVDGDDWYAQTFTPEISHAITKVVLYLKQSNENGGDLIYSIKAVDESGYPAGDDLCSGTLDLSLYLDSTYAWVVLPLTPAYNLIASTQYAIVCRCPEASYGYGATWDQRLDLGADSYPGGAWLWSSDAGDSWEMWDDPEYEYGGEVGVYYNFYFEEWGYEPLDFMTLDETISWLAGQNYTTLQAIALWLGAHNYTTMGDVVSWADTNNVLMGGIGMPLWYLFGLAALAAGAWWSRSMLVNIMVAAMAGGGFPLADATLEVGSALYWAIYLILILAIVYSLIQIFTRVDHW